MEIEILNARIQSVRLGYDRGDTMPSAWVMLEMKGSGVGYGGFLLGGEFTHAFIFGVLDAVGVERWEDLPGTPCRIESTGWGGKCLAIGHFLEDKWFNANETFKQMKAKKEAQ